MSATTNPSLISCGGKPIDFSIKNINEDDKGIINVIVSDYDISTGLHEINCKEDTDSRYYNLPCMEVTNPFKGQLLIEKSESSKKNKF